MAKKTKSTSIPVHGRFHFQSIIPRFTDTAVALLNGDIGDALRAFSGALGGKNDEPEAQAYTLLWQCMKGAVRRIFEHRFREGNEIEALDIRVFEHTKQFCIDLWSVLQELDIVIDRRFIDNPMQHETTLILRDFLKSWMQKSFKISEIHAQVAVASFPRYFLQEMAELSRTDFLQLFTFFEKPFFLIEDKEIALDIYEANLINEFNRPAFENEQVSLAEMYIPPYFRFFKRIWEEEGHIDRVIFQKPRKKLLLKDFLKAWLSGECPEDTPQPNAQVILLLGQPGQGKSSFCYNAVYEILAENRILNGRVFLLRLRDLANRQDLIKQPLQIALKFLQEYKLRKINLQRTDLHQGLLILDGLDEFYMNNGLSYQEIDEFLDNLIRDIRLEMETSIPAIKLHCLVTSRSNYVRLENYHRNDLLILQIAEMQLFEQQKWLECYEKTLKWLSDEDQTRKAVFIKKLHSSLIKMSTSIDKKERRLIDLVNQPILLQIVTETETDPLKTDNRAQLYNELFDQLVQRTWAKKEGQIRSLEVITKDRGRKLFRQFLRALAVHIFYSEHDYARRSDFSEQPLKKAVANLRKVFPDQSDEEYLRNLMVSFYFKEVKKDETDSYIPDERSNYAYEFLHKSLQEYLVAEYFTSFFCENLIESDDFDDFRESDETAMEKIFDMFSPRILNSEIIEYLYEIIRNNKNLALLETKVFPRSKKLMFMLSKYSFLWRFDALYSDLPSFRKKKPPLQQAIATFYGLISINGALVSSLARNVTWPVASEIDFGKKLKEIQARFHFLADESIDFLLLINGFGIKTSICLAGADLLWIMCPGVHLNNSDFRGANLSGANFRGAVLRGANFSSADMSGIHLAGANIHNAYLIGADLTGAELAGADLTKADLKDADLRGANLAGADLIETDLQRVSLAGADLAGANFYHANLSGTTFFGQLKYEFDTEHEVYIQNPGSKSAQNLDKILNLDKALNKNKADWTGTIYEGKVWDEAEE